MQGFKINFRMKASPQMNHQVTVLATDEIEAKNYFIHQMFEKGLIRARYHIMSVKPTGLTYGQTKVTILEAKGVAI